MDRHFNPYPHPMAWTGNRWSAAGIYIGAVVLVAARTLASPAQGDNFRP